MENGCRKINDIWNAIDDQRIYAKMKKTEWRRSFDGTNAALNYIGLKLITTKEELDSMEVPIEKKCKYYSYRKVLVLKDGIISSLTRIKDLIRGHSKLLTQDEKIAIYDKNSKDQIIARPKGIAINNKTESETIDSLNILINMDSIFNIKHLDEFRLADICYKEITDTCNLYFPEQVKTATAGENERCVFNGNKKTLTVATMKSIIQTGINLTCIGKTHEGKIDVVWTFYGEKSLNMLSQFEDKQLFQPQLHLKVKSSNKFTAEYNKPEYRFDVGKNEKECERLFAYRSEVIISGKKYSLKYLNEDDSQIPSENHRREHKSFAFTRDTCAIIGVIVKKNHKDSYGPVDFLVNETKVQDKVAGVTFKIRRLGQYPINPDTIDVLQISFGNIVYIINMRKFDKDKQQIVSTLSPSELMNKTVNITTKWKKDYAKNMHDLSILAGIKSYIKACQEAKDIPQLSDSTFYDKIIQDNSDIFIKETKKRRENRIKKKAKLC